MKPAPFRYERPDTLGGALELLERHRDEAKVLAGGQSLLPLMSLRLATPPILVDIGRITELDRIEVGERGVTIGALVRHADAEGSESIAEHAPLVHAAMPLVGHRAIRNRGTVCGSLAHGDPAAEMPAVAVAGDATLIAASTRGEREIPAAEFFRGYLDTALDDDELLIAARFPRQPAGTRSTVVEISRRHGDYALVGLAAQVSVAGGEVSHAALAFLGASDTPVRVPAVESRLIGTNLAAAVIDAAAASVAETLDPPADIHATAAYRRHVAGVLTRRALTQLAGEERA
jgi:carbon-monoxide dehydrogenase medium subunit